MPTIESFTGTWDAATTQVRLDWYVTGLTDEMTLKVGAQYKEILVPKSLTAPVGGNWRGSQTVAGGPNGRKDYNLVVIQNGKVVVENTKQVRSTITVLFELMLEDAPAFVNGGFDWLTYETVLNKPKFRKTNQPRKIGLYAANMADMQLWIRTDIPDGSLKALCDSFFPDHSLDEVKRLSKSSWWWQQQQSEFDKLKSGTAPYYKQSTLKPPAADTAAWLPESEVALVGSRAVLKIQLPRYVMMPYNYWDNDEGSRALGTNGSHKLHSFPMIQVKDDKDDATSWDVWRTASRSSVMLLKNVKAPYAEWPKKDWKRWPFEVANVERDRFKNKSPEWTLAVIATRTSRKRLRTKPARAMHAST